MRKNFTVGVLAFSIWTGGCAGVQSLQLAHPDEMNNQVTLVALSYELENKKGPEDDCELNIQNKQSGAEYSLKLAGSGEKVVFAEVPAGTYVSKKLRCYSTSAWGMSDLFDVPLQVQSGKINVAGKVIFQFSKDTSAMSHRFGNRKANLLSIKEVFKRLPDHQKKRVVSAYTGKPVTEKMVESESDYQFSVLVTRKKGENVQGEPLLEDVKECGEADAQRDPLQIAHLNYLAHYDDGRLAKLEKTVNFHALTPEFEACLLRAFEDFKAPGKSKFTIRFRT